VRWRPDRALLTAAVVVLVDQWTKWLAFTSLEPGDSAGVLPGLNLSRVENEGIAFGAFAGRPALVFGLMAAALGVLVWFYLRHRTRPGLWLATGLLLGGAIGNAIDRVWLGYVRDFLELPHFPTFNFADVAITFGVVVLVLSIEQQPEADEDREARDDAAGD
jgi:signal peptidase II